MDFVYPLCLSQVIRDRKFGKSLRTSYGTPIILNNVKKKKALITTSASRAFIISVPVFTKIVSLVPLWKKSILSPPIKGSYEPQKGNVSLDKGEWTVILLKRLTRLMIIMIYPILFVLFTFFSFFLWFNVKKKFCLASILL